MTYGSRTDQGWTYLLTRVVHTFSTLSPTIYVVLELDYLLSTIIMTCLDSYIIRINFWHWVIYHPLKPTPSSKRIEKYELEIDPLL